MKTPYPATITCDRYGGAYSGGVWTAWNVDPLHVADDQDGGDIQCALFWSTTTLPIGRGNTPQEALDDLAYRLGYR